MTDDGRKKAGLPERAYDADAGKPAAPRQRRMSVRKKQEVVLRVLRGEDLEVVSREVGTTAADLSAWRDSFLEAGAASLKSRLGTDQGRELKAMREKIGEMTMANELLEARINRLEAGVLFGCGGRSDEPDLFDLREAPLRSGMALPVLAHQPRDAAPASEGRELTGRPATPPGPPRGALRCRAGQAHPYSAR